jgi:hypothetical protein
LQLELGEKQTHCIHAGTRRRTNENRENWLFFGSERTPNNESRQITSLPPKSQPASQALRNPYSR